jgi:hypothetical protein
VCLVNNKQYEEKKLVDDSLVKKYSIHPSVFADVNV